jgi:hypothetical protein
MHRLAIIGFRGSQPFIVRGTRRKSKKHNENGREGRKVILKQNYIWIYIINVIY